MSISKTCAKQLSLIGKAKPIRCSILVQFVGEEEAEYKEVSVDGAKEKIYRTVYENRATIKFSWDLPEFGESLMDELESGSIYLDVDDLSDPGNLSFKMESFGAEGDPSETHDSYNYYKWYGKEYDEDDDDEDISDDYIDDDDEESYDTEVLCMAANFEHTSEIQLKFDNDKELCFKLEKEGFRLGESDCVMSMEGIIEYLADILDNDID